jgi:SAM-dependent methyltransferase
LSTLEIEPQGKTMLEIGCGVGRVTRSFAKRFARVYALDVSEEMLQRARDLHPGYENITWLRGGGDRLAQLADQSMDFAFSYLTLQHMPSAPQGLECVREIVRVLKPGGAYCFQFNSNVNPTMNWRGRLIWAVLDRLQEPVWGLNLEFLGVRIASVLGLDFLQGGRTWHGAALSPRDVLEALWQSGGAVRGVAGWGTAETWCYGHKAGMALKPVNTGPSVISAGVP